MIYGLKGSDDNDDNTSSHVNKRKRKNCETSPDVTDATPPSKSRKVDETSWESSDSEAETGLQSASDSSLCQSCHCINESNKVCKRCQALLESNDALKDELKYLQQKNDALKDELKYLQQKNAILKPPMGWTTQTGAVRLVPLSSVDPEFKSIKDMMVRSLGARCFIKSVEQVENLNLFQMYSLRKAQLAKENGTAKENERMLFHGTSSENVRNIVVNGFNRSYCKSVGLYGRGIYFTPAPCFAASPCYSSLDHHGLQRLFYSRVLTGQFTYGRATMVEPPVIAGSYRFNSVVDSIEGPTMYCIFNDYQAYPDFLITFSTK